MTWLLIYYITWDLGFTFTKEQEGIPYYSKQDCMEQLEVMKDNALKTDGTIIELYCKPKKE